LNFLGTTAEGGKTPPIAGDAGIEMSFLASSSALTLSASFFSSAARLFELFFECGVRRYFRFFRFLVNITAVTFYRPELSKRLQDVRRTRLM